MEYLVGELPKRGDEVEHKPFGKGMILGMEYASEHQKISIILKGNVRNNSSLSTPI